MNFNIIKFYIINVNAKRNKLDILCCFLNVAGKHIKDKYILATTGQNVAGKHIKDIYILATTGQNVAGKHIKDIYSSHYWPKW